MPLLIFVYAIAVIWIFLFSISSARQNRVENIIRKSELNILDKEMDIVEVKRHLLRWINSCKTREQADQIPPLIKHYITKRFFNKVPMLDLILVQEDLHEALNEVRTRLICKQMDALKVPTLSVYLQN